MALTPRLAGFTTSTLEANVQGGRPWALESGRLWYKSQPCSHTSRLSEPPFTSVSRAQWLPR